MKNNRILVVGDIMIDRYIIGDVNRICSEAPVPIFETVSEYSTLGGAGNVVKNLSSLECEVHFAGICGYDSWSEVLGKQLSEYCFDYKLIDDKKRKTTVKSRYICQNKQIFREDRESTQDYKYSREQLERLDRFINNKNFNIIVLSDYGKGTVTKELMEVLTKHKIRILVDPKPRNFNLYNNTFLIKPNKKEYEEIVRINNIKDIRYSHLVVTEGENGCSLYNNDGKLINHYDALKRKEVVDITGAGDTFISVLSYCISLNLSMDLSLKISNECSAIVISEFGTTAIKKKDFEDVINKYI